MPGLEDVFPRGKLSLMCIPFTAFSPDSSSIVLSEVQKQAEFAVTMGNDACLLQGTTGEWPSLSLSERLELAAEWRRCIPYGHPCKLVLHIGHDAIPDAITLAKLAQELKFDGVLLSPPSKFVAPSLEAQVSCLKEVLQHCATTPSFYYHYPGVYRDGQWDLVELFEMAKEMGIANLCGCKLSGCTVEQIEKYGSYSPETHAVITTGQANLIRSIKLPAVRSAIISSWEPPIYRPVLEAFDEGRFEDAKILEDYINKSRGPVAALNQDLGQMPPASSTAVYSICANKALANALEGTLGPCRLPLQSVTDEAMAAKLVKDVVPFLEPLRLEKEKGEAVPSAKL